jgi:uncharacterized membrane protein YeiH
LTAPVLDTAPALDPTPIVNALPPLDAASAALYVASLLGVAVAAVSGALGAGRKGFDLMGVVVLAMATAIGGGTLRDLLVDRRPIFWVADPAYVLVVLAAAGGTVLYARFRDPPWQVLLAADAVMLAFFTISGARAAEEVTRPAVIVVTMATITGSAGGVIRDVLSRDVPLLFRPSEPLYATASIVGATLYLALQRAGVRVEAAAGAGMAAVLLLRFASVRWRWRLPRFVLRDSPGGKPD